MTATRYEYEYQVSKRVTLRPGDKFRARGGPFYRTPGGKIPLSASRAGPFTFKRVSIHGSSIVIEALDKNGAFAPLHVSGRRRSVCKQIVPRPYRVTGKLRPKKTGAAQ
jgi:hypothetical protein